MIQVVVFTFIDMSQNGTAGIGNVGFANTGGAVADTRTGSWETKDATGKKRFMHEPVWKYLFTHPVDKVGQAVPMDADCEKNQQQ